MISRLVTLFTLFLTLSSSVHRVEVQEDLDWYEGYVVMKDGKVHEGLISFDHKQNIALLKIEGRISSLSSRDTYFFTYYEEQNDVMRTFLSVKHRPKRYPIMEFYELVMDGTLQLFRKGEEKRTQKPFYKYMALVDERLVSLTRFTSRILPKLIEEQPELDSIINKYQLRTWDTFDQIVIVDHYNYLSDPSYDLQVDLNSIRFVDVK